MIELKRLSKSFVVKKSSSKLRARQTLHAVRDINLVWGNNDFLAIVGESGCGKSTLGRMIAGIIAPSEGEILSDGVNTAGLSGAHRRKWARMAQLIPQDPYAALNPVRRIRDMMADPLSYHNIVAKQQIAGRTEELLASVGLNSASVMDKYPHQLSGGQRQRVVVARALTVEPQYLIADEAVSMVDVSLRIGIMDSMKAIAFKRQLGLLFITHDFRVARYIAQGGRIAVMYLGRIVEIGPTEEVLQCPQHPYTQALISAVPLLEGRERRVETVIPNSYELTESVTHQGCPFEPRCPFATDHCRAVAPELAEITAGHHAACHFASPRQLIEDTALHLA